MMHITFDEYYAWPRTRAKTTARSSPDIADLDRVADLDGEDAGGKLEDVDLI